MTRSLCLLTLVSCLAGCGDMLERMNGYPAKDTALNLETASSNQIADALSQLARIAVIGDDWEFADPNDPCTLQVIDKSAAQNHQLDLRGATFQLKRDPQSKNYYAVMQHGQAPFTGHDGKPLRLFETASYHDVFFAEGYLLALAQKCQQAKPLPLSN